ncbi:PAC2 family protein [Corynebacterium uberis]|uniref:PAC2 family protein n=1 Tax=Corynebacterium uberis TaxID=2883169 RepID=UPI001D0BCB68|nr:PAC2 family protein [Corynebacterium uberis]UDL74161.1 PAC2 family protein [Corynebacterium uberis]UDL74955.1 PAC2 family protein [Corynebacterium uberis]UDL77170.1 PAC2 family protein [Corynebacterium uberis]UDL81584.1 PAC2 family protein [Corynebacterium uberis]
MHDNRDMYELEYPTPDIAGEGAPGPVLIIALQGYADAGQAVSASSDHLLAALDNRLVASFNTDELIDFRSRRPVVTMRDHEVTDIDDITLDMRVLRDSDHHSFLLLSGPEPDLRWGAFTRAVTNLVDKYNVSQVICLYAAPMTVPHTRPLMVSAHGNAPDHTGQRFHFDGKVILPGSASLTIEKALSDSGHNVAGFTAHVPHYVSSSPYPEATYRLLSSVADQANLKFPLQTLEHDRQRIAQQLAEQVADSPEIQQVVAALEIQYDEELDSYRNTHPRAVMPGEEDLPSGEELGEEFERFLAQLDEPSNEKPSDDEPSDDEPSDEDAPEEDASQPHDQEDPGDSSDEGNNPDA